MTVFDWFCSALVLTVMLGTAYYGLEFKPKLKSHEECCATVVDHAEALFEIREHTLNTLIDGTGPVIIFHECGDDPWTLTMDACNRLTNDFYYAPGLPDVLYWDHKPEFKEELDNGERKLCLYMRYTLGVS